jgi:SAM-dependent methyltransferase
MHDTSLRSGKSFADTYGISGGLVVDIGGRNVNGSLRSFFENKGMRFICVDMEADPSVDIVTPPGDKLPFEDGSVDLIVSTSCFEHDPCFWLTFKEMTRIIKPTGFIYINAPTSGPYHSYPGDNWRFYSDAGQALAFWSAKQMSNETIFPVKVIETFNVLGDHWNDFVCVWRRVDIVDKETTITTRSDLITNIGILEKNINDCGLKTRKKC